jgi:hypothetical protein
MPTKPPKVQLEQVFVRDHQRRLRLVVELLEQELRQRGLQANEKRSITGSEYSQSLLAPYANSGGQLL